MPTKIKICGITREEDALDIIALADEGLKVDYLGFVFYEKSKRFVTPENVQWINQLPKTVQTVGLFVNPTKDYVDNICQQLRIDLLQFHGDESPEFCEQFNRAYIKAVPMEKLSKDEAIAYMQSYPNADGFLLDNYGKNEIGGSGTTFNWSKIPDQAEITKHQLKLIMAGGLNADNIGTVIEQVNSWAVDVSSGVESAPGIKSIEKVRAFVGVANN